MPYKRQSIGKKKRFEIFARDEFTCRYCGDQPPNVQLVIDHVRPVAEGGGNDATNLITACFDCNSGKGKTVLETLAPNDQDTARMAQEFMEQKRLAQLAREAADARDEICQVYIDRLCSVLGAESIDKRNANRLVRVGARHGPDKVFEWLDYASDMVSYHTESNVMKYFNGIVRRQDEVSEVMNG
ncbi:MAG: HNH endonuclease [Marivivens sp.]|nr:HNH endonuclease [Marivivens sp.]NBT50000.1 HNH endonuclease [Marivivens sp.]NCW67384.1 HNH endonuclease [Marivivens sp.]NDH01714.1 HNH endonuclease [Marivivens sp.]